jgi:DNA replication protein DnaC
VVDELYIQNSIIPTSNRAMNDLANIFPDPIMANAIMDQLAHNAHQIIIISQRLFRLWQKGESYRKKYRPKFAYGE